MAKLMVEIDIPNYEYDELSEMFEKGMASTIPGLIFDKISGRALVHERYLGGEFDGGYRRFLVIGVRP